MNRFHNYKILFLALSLLGLLVQGVPTPRAQTSVIATTSKDTPTLSLLLKLRGGDEDEEEESDVELEVEEDVVAVALETAVDVSKRLAVLVEKYSKIAGVWLGKVSILYYEACKRAVLAGMEGGEYEEEDEMDKDEDEDIPKALVICKKTCKKVYFTLKRMTVAFWTVEREDGEAGINQVSKIIESLRSFFSNIKLRRSETDEASKLVKSLGSFFSKIKQIRSEADEEMDGEIEYEEEETIEVDLDSEPEVTPSVEEVKVTVETVKADLTPPAKKATSKTIKTKAKRPARKGTTKTLKTVGGDQATKVKTLDAKAVLARQRLKRAMAGFGLAIASALAFEKTKDQFLPQLVEFFAKTGAAKSKLLKGKD